jgi:hypothetical protein
VAAGDAGSLLTRIASRPPAPGRDPREDRATEVLAAVLDHERTGDAAHRLATAWLEEGPEDVREALEGAGAAGAIVSTQEWLFVGEAAGRVDLVMTFVTGSGEPVVLRVEVKHGDKPRRSQLHLYRAAPVTGPTAVVLLAPRADYARFEHDEIPDGVVRATWQETAALILARAREDGDDDEVQRFLLEELWCYLRDERLTDPERLERGHLGALRDHDAALTALTRMGDLAAARVRTARPDQPFEAGHRRQRQFWWPAAPEDEFRDVLSDTWWWDWKVFVDGRDMARDLPPAPTVFAGLTAVRGALAGLDDTLAAALRQRDFRLVPGEFASAGNDFVVAFDRLDDVVSLDAVLDHQADALATWLGDRFESLSEVLAERRG